MAGTFTIEVNDREVDTALAGIIRRMEERIGFYRSVAELLRGSAMTNFKKQSGPDGTPWRQLKAATIRRRISRKQTPIEILSSNTKSGSSLRGSISMEADNDSARVGVMDRIPYAAIHQFGGTIQIPARAGRVYRHYDPTSGATGRKFASPKSDGARATEVDIPAYAITMPARPYLGISDADEMEIMLLAEDWIDIERGG